MRSKPIEFYSNVAQKSKTSSRLLKPQIVAPNAKKLKSCRAQSEQAYWWWMRRNERHLYSQAELRGGREERRKGGGIGESAIKHNS